MLDLAIVGAGPIGIEAAIRAKRAGLAYAVLEKGAIVQAVVDYPTYMTFFTTAERLEVGGHPFVTATGKATRKEALDYYRKVVDNEDLDVRTVTAVTGLERGPDGVFALTVRDGRAGEGIVRAHAVALATGYYDRPKMLGVPGEDLPHVSHYYTESHPFWRRDVVIVGAGSSAADAALDLFRGGARVTMVHRGGSFRHSLKYWIRPDLENRVKEGSIRVRFRSEVEEIREGEIDIVTRPEGEREVRETLPADAVFLLTGYAADPVFAERLGVRTDPVTRAAELDPDTFETSVPGLYMIGSAGFGTRTSDVFIENGLVHAARALGDVTARTAERRRAAAEAEGAGASGDAEAIGA